MFAKWGKKTVGLLGAVLKFQFIGRASGTWGNRDVIHDMLKHQVECLHPLPLLLLALCYQWKISERSV